MGVRWQACWTVTTGDTVDWYEYDRCLRGFSYPLRKPATADCARSPDAQAACSLPVAAARTRPARRAHPHSPGRPRRPGRMQSASTGSTATRHATPDSSLGRGVDKQGLDSRLDSGCPGSAAPDGARRASADTRSSSPHAPARRVGDRGACRVAGSSTARAQVSAVTQRGGESNYLDSHTIPST